SAQTWLDPTSGSWSVGANWLGGVAPVSSASTQLTFNSSGSQSYTATNDIADPFMLNTLNLNNAGTVGFNVSGQSLLFAGAGRAINLAGAGPVHVAAPIQLSSTGGQDITTIGGTGAETLFLDA